MRFVLAASIAAAGDLRHEPLERCQAALLLGGWKLRKRSVSDGNQAFSALLLSRRFRPGYRHNRLIRSPDSYALLAQIRTNFNELRRTLARRVTAATGGSAGVFQTGSRET